MAGKEIEKDKKGEIDMAGKGDVDISSASSLGKKDLVLKNFRSSGSANTNLQQTGPGQIAVDTNLNTPAFNESEQAQAALAAAAASVAAAGTIEHAIAEEETLEAIAANKAARERALAQQTAAEQEAAQAQAGQQQEEEIKEEPAATHATPPEHAEQPKSSASEPNPEEGTDQQKKQPEQKPSRTTKTPPAPAPNEKANPKEKQTEEQPASEVPPTEQQPADVQAKPTSGPQTKTSPETKIPATKTPPSTEKPPTKNEEVPSKTPPKPEEKPTSQPAPQTPPPAESGLSDVGPHPTQEPKTPPTLDKEKQPDVANQAAEKKALDANRDDNGIMRDGYGPKTNKPVGNAPNAPKKTMPRSVFNNAKNRARNAMESKRSRRRKIKKEIEASTKELKKLENKIDDVKASGKMRIIKFLFPGLYAKVMGISMGAKNLKGQAKVAILETKLVTIKTVRGFMEGSKLVAAMVDANTVTLEILAPLFVTIVLAIIGAILYLFIFIPTFIGIYATGKGAFTTAFDEIIKQLKGIIENILKALKPEKKKIQLRRKISSLEEAWREGSALPAANDNTESKEPPKTQDGPPAANDNTEQPSEESYKQAA